MPETVTSLSGALVLLSCAVIVTVPVLLLCPAGIVSCLLALSAKSPATAGPTGTAETVTVVSALDGWLSDAVIVLTC